MNKERSIGNLTLQLRRVHNIDSMFPKGATQAEMAAHIII